jgi:hydrogenase nickel incorporation protein HypB
MEIKILKNILNANDQIAQNNRQLLASNNIFAVNVMASPGAGKTSLIINTIQRLQSKIKIAVIEGDISSNIDSEMVGKTGTPVVQINTGGECHLNAAMVNNALNSLPLDDFNLLFIENVGNLVCPADFMLGESLKILITHTPEGDDKPYKYPNMFTRVDAVIINKIDLLPYVKFDVGRFSEIVRGLNSNARIFPLSCSTGEGLDSWAGWLGEKVQGIS